MDRNETAQLTNPVAAEPATTAKEILVKGKPISVDTIVVDGKTIVVTGKFMRTARLENEWYEDADAPRSLIDGIRKSRIRADILTFWQRLPNTTPQFSYYHEWDSIAAIPITSVDHWLTKQLNTKARNLLRKSAKAGVVVTQASFDEAFIKGMADIFNETPVRQNKPFFHYGKDAETIKREFSRYLFREELFGAFQDNALLGFMFLADAGRYGMLGQILSKIEHRDKAPTNALIAKAVEICAQKGLPYLVYDIWVTGTLGHFKAQNGFEKFDLPRYYVPLTPKGRLILKLGLHHGLAGVIPNRLRAYLVKLRNSWYSRQQRLATSSIQSSKSQS
ncbi:MAG: hypothetical protein WBD07_18810 [Vicinamibacterales bacterium]